MSGEIELLPIAALTYVVGHDSGGVASRAVSAWALSSQPANAAYECVITGSYVDNINTMENQTANSGTAINAVSSIVGGSSYTNGTYYNVALTGGSGTGAFANITVSGGAVTAVALMSGGSSFAVSDTISCLAAGIGGTGSGWSATVASLTGTRGNAATRYRDPIIHYERAANGFSGTSNAAFFACTYYIEGGNIGPTGDTYDTSVAVIMTHGAGAVNFAGTQYKALEVRGDNGNIYFSNHSGGKRFGWNESTGGVTIGTDTGVNSPPTNGLLISGNIGGGTSSNALIAASMGGGFLKMEWRGSVNIDPSGLGSATNVVSVIRNVATDGYRYTQSGVGAAFFGHSTGAVFGSDGTSLLFKTGISGGDTSTGTTRLTVSTSKITAALPIVDPSFTVATVPSASSIGAGGRIYVSDESGGATPAFSDATNWRRVADRAIIS